MPCVVFAFNRPDKLRRILAGLKGQNIDQLIVFVDGPRNQQDVEAVEKCKFLATGIEWAEKNLYFHDQNFGLTGLIDNINVVMSAFNAAVFLEDDCLPMPGFYSFMCQALAYYKSEEKVFSIGGYQPIPPSFFKNYPFSVVSTARFMCWGWATWKDRWQKVAPYVIRYEQMFENLSHVTDIAGEDIPVMAQSLVQGKLESWAVRVSLATLWLKMVHLLPARGLVRNIGIDTSGAHGGRRTLVRAKRFHNKNLSAEILGPPIWLEDTSLNCDYAERLKEFVRNTRGSPNRDFKNKIGRVLKRRLQLHWERLFDLQLEEDIPSRLTKRALLAYIVYPFSIPRSDLRFLRHINIWHAQEIVKVLNRLGYTVDVIDYRDTKYIPKRQYDLFIGHAGINFEHITECLLDETITIFFSTGSYWKFHNRQELSRFRALRKRRGVDQKPDRFIEYSEEGALLKADGIIGIGNDFTKRTYTNAGFSSVIMINGTTLYDDHYEWCEKDFFIGRDHFLYYSGRGSVHKGLDLLLEAFIGLKQQLWICSRVKSQFKAVYSRELLDFKNIHYIGWVQPRSRQYYDILRRCVFNILPSSSEGQSQSVVECMNQGLIPVVTPSCGLDTNDYGIRLEPCTVENIRSVVQELSASSPERCREMSLKARQVAVTVYSEEAFSSSMRAAIFSIVADKKTKGR